MPNLLQDVLRQHAASVDSDLIAKLKSTRLQGSLSPEETSDDELVGVISLPATPSHSRPTSRPGSPTRGAAKRPIPGPLLLSSRATSSDPLKILPTDLSQRIFALLPLKDLAVCAVISKKWKRSQTLNYVWFRHYRKENFHDESLPPGKWTRRESKQDWRVILLQSIRKAHSSGVSYSSSLSGYSTPTDGFATGYQTPREIREERWRAEAAAVARPNKVEMREMYKELGGRKVRGKGKIHMSDTRDRGGWEDEGSGW